MNPTALTRILTIYAYQISIGNIWPTEITGEDDARWDCNDEGERALVSAVVQESEFDLEAALEHAFFKDIDKLNIVMCVRQGLTTHYHRDGWALDLPQQFTKSVSRQAMEYLREEILWRKKVTWEALQHSERWEALHEAWLLDCSELDEKAEWNRDYAESR